MQFDKNISDFAQENGQIPLPPYVKRQPDSNDLNRYQTVFANEEKAKAVAAPTAGLHFDDKMLSKIKAKGVHIVKVTLHIGPGTFLPIRTDNIDNHKMHSEEWHLSNEAASTLNHIRQNNGQIVAVGTTVVQVLETAIKQSKSGEFEADFRATNIFIKPGCKFKAVDKLLTNFHLPKSTLLLLVCAAAGKK